MRTRFLATDYFHSPTPTSDQTLTLATLRFLSLPLPPPPPEPNLSAAADLSAALAAAAADIAGDELDELPIGAALSEFLASVLPQAHRPSPAAADEGLVELLCDKDEEGVGFRSTIPQGLDEKDGTREGFRSNAPTASKIPEGWELWKELKFEVVEAELPTRECASFDEEEAGGMSLGMAFSYAKVPLDPIDTEVEITIRYPIEIVESIYHVESIPARSNDDQDNCFAEDNNCSAVAAPDHGIAIPQLEVSVHPWELGECLSSTEMFNTFLRIVECLDGAPGQDSAVNIKEILGPTEVDMLTCICEDVQYEDYQEDEPLTVKSAVEMDLMRINDSILLEKSSVIYPVKPDGTCSDMPCSILLQEVQIIDFPSSDPFEMLIESEKAEMDIYNLKSEEDLGPARSLYEHMVSSELALVDNVFKSLPAPILTDDTVMKQLPPLVPEILCCLTPHPLSACDSIYLDWHLLLEGSCDRDICGTYVSMIEEVNTCSLSSEIQMGCQQSSNIGIDFLNDFQRSAILYDEDKRNEICVNAPQSHDLPVKLEITQKHKEEIRSGRGKCQMEKLDSEKAASLFESMSRSNGLNFFLDVRRGIKRGANNENRGSLDVLPPVTKSKEPTVLSLGPKVKNVQSDMEIHLVSLSDNILGVINDIHKCYIAALEESTYLRNSFPDKEGLSISKQKLLELITGEGSKGFNNHCKDEDKMELVTLYALKQVAYYLCFFGLHAAQLYISHLTGSFVNIPERLRNIQCFISNAQSKAEKQLTESHPSLFYVEQILRSNCKTGQKVLIIADEAFWLPLAHKLTSMKMTFVELRKCPAAAQFDPMKNMGSANCELEEFPQSDCILLDINNIPASFPFSKFGIILEYGGSNQSSRLSSRAHNFDGLPPLHFLYVRGGTEDLPAALFDGYHTAEHLKSTLDTVLDTLEKDLQEKLNKKRIIDSLNFVPATGQLHIQDNLNKKNMVDLLNFMAASDQLCIQENRNEKIVVDALNFVPASGKSICVSSESANMIKASQDNQSGTDLPYSVKFDNIESTRSSFPEVVIIVNTQSHQKDMLISRRTSYQKILALEKGGAQVVEREIDLPVDIIFSAAVCLVWYENRTCGYNTLTAVAESSSVVIFMENIATNVLMSLSFSFSGCIMVFEGENNFLSAVMESSDALYAAAASLDMNLHLFYSHTPESTDEIILGCIRNVTRLNRGLYPAMPDSESLAESFLTRFPCINPLSAHAILSHGGTLVEFLQWSSERRIQAVRKYLLSPESISLLSSLCKFGELGESKSVMTECSSVDSDISSALLRSPRKREKRASQSFAVPTTDPLCLEPSNHLPGDYMKHDDVFFPPKLRKFLDVDDVLLKPQEVFMGGKSLNRREGDCSQPSNYDADAVIGDQLINDDFCNGMIEHMNKLDERPCYGKGTCSFSWQPESETQPPIRNSLPTSRLAFSNTYSHPSFPTSLEISGDASDWKFVEGANQTWKGKINGEVATSSCTDVGGRHHESTGELMQDPASSLVFLKQEIRHDGTSHGLGWEIDYLRRMNENRRARQERVRCNTSVTSTISRMKNTPSKILSPSTLETFRYQGSNPSRCWSPSVGTCRYSKGREGTKIQKQRGRKDLKIQPSPNHEKRKYPSFNPTWTPVDKRARQKLSFATYGNEKQSKLVWRHENSPGIGCGLRKRHRDG